MSQRDTFIESATNNIDNQYKPFPPFSVWANLEVAVASWNKLQQQLTTAKKAVSKEIFSRALDFTLRTAAIDTGALEGLYLTNRNFTMSVATQAIVWEAENQEQQDIRRFFEAQFQAYELVLDAVTGATPLSEAWVRELHHQICDAQDTYQVLTPSGLQNQPLPKGEYKKYPNHVALANGTFFAYAPVKETPHETRRLLDEINTDSFKNAHPALQSAYVHYAFILIHPFADGNGRVARAFASLYLYRALSIPLIIYYDQRDDYLSALRKADKGEPQVFLDFIYNRGIETMGIQISRLNTLEHP